MTLILAVIGMLISIITVVTVAFILVISVFKLLSMVSTIKVKIEKPTKKDTLIMALSVIYLLTYLLLPKPEVTKYVLEYSLPETIVDIRETDKELIVTKEKKAVCVKHTQYNTGYSLFDAVFPEVFLNKKESTDNKYCIQELMPK